MTEKITREEIEGRLEKARSGLAEHEKYTDHVNGELRTTSKAFVKHFQKEIALCTLALQALDMEPRSIEEAPKEGNFIGFLEDGRACTMSWRQHIKNWKPVEGGGHVPDGYHWLTCEEDHDSYTPRKAIAWMPFPPLTSLPEPRR